MIRLAQNLIQDFRHALRLSQRSKSLALGVVVSMGLGIGAAASVFSFVDSFVFRPLPVPETDRVVHLATATPASPAGGGFSYPEYHDYTERNQSFSGIVTYHYVTVALAPNLRDQPRVALATLVSGNFFSTLQVKPAVGRGFLPEEDSVPGRDAVAVLSHTTWQSDFGSARDVVGRAVAVNGHTFTVIGVAPEDFTGVAPFLEPGIYIPRMMIQQALPAGTDNSALTNRSIRPVGLFARLKPQVSLEQAKDDIERIAKQLESEHPETNKDIKVGVYTQVGFRLADRPGFLSLSSLLLAVAFLVLGIACVNVSNLLLSTAPARTREMAIRAALGAPRARLVRQFLLESAILSGAGTLAGLAVASWCAGFLASMRMGSDLPVGLSVRVDQRVVVFTLGVGLVAAFLSGALPAWRCSRNDLNSLLKSSDLRNRQHKTWGRQLLSGAQIAVTTLLLIFSGLSLKQLQIAATQSPGFRVANVLTMSFDPSFAGFDHEKTNAFYKALVERVRATPGVKSAAIAQDKPFGVINNSSTNLTIEGYEMPANQQSLEIRTAFVGDGYFDTMDIPIIRGRVFDRQDGVNAPRTVIVNETMAQRYWPNRDPIGARVEIKGADGGPAEVIGIARNSKYGSMIEEPMPFLYRSYDQSSETGAALLVETEGRPETLTASIRTEVSNIAPNMPIFDVRTMENHFREVGLLEPRFLAQMLTAVGIVGLILGVLGLYGVIAYSLGQRRYEIGIRMAVGAANRQILRMTLLRGLATSGIASAVGCGLALALRIRTFLPDDSVVYGGVLVLMLIVTGFACYIPARRASMVDPNITLRSEL